MMAEPEHWTLSRTLSAQAGALGNATWVEDVSGRAASFAEIDRRASAIAAGLVARGLGRGGRVLLLADNSIDFIAIFFGIVRAGVVAVPVNTALSGVMLSHVCRDADASLLIADMGGLARFAEIAGSVAQVTRLILIAEVEPPTPATLTVELLRALEEDGDAGGFEEPECDEADVAAILYTSGTTGASKGVLLPNAHLIQNAWLYILNMRMTAADSVYCVLPMFHLNALTLQLCASLIAGCRVTIRARFSASAWIDDVRRCGATLTNLLGSMTEFVFAQPERQEDGDNRLRHIVAVPTQKAIRDRFEARFGVRLIELYGMTEITCPIYMPLDAPQRPGSCGHLLEDWFEAQIVDPETDMEVPTGSVGELVVRPLRANAFMAGYFRRPEAAVKAWRNLWFHTGDAMRRDADGYFYFVDRLKDCVRRRGENVSTFEVEQAILSSGLVREIAVVGVESPVGEGEQEIKACVVLETDATVAALVSFCEENLPYFAVPRIVEVIDALPKTSTGKIEKRLLREAGITAGAWVDPNIAKPRKRA